MSAEPGLRAQVLSALEAMRAAAADNARSSPETAEGLSIWRWLALAGIYVVGLSAAFLSIAVSSYFLQGNPLGESLAYAGAVTGWAAIMFGVLLHWIVRRQFGREGLVPYVVVGVGATCLLLVVSTAILYP